MRIGSKVPGLLTGRAGIQRRQPDSRIHVHNRDASQDFGCDALGDRFPVSSVQLTSSGRHALQLNKSACPNAYNYKNLDKQLFHDLLL